MNTSDKPKKKPTLRQRIFNIRGLMISRCYNPNDTGYKNYGARGITICDEWLNDKEAFYKWSIENGADFGLQIDRKDVNGSYCPENCHWVTSRENNNNRRNNVKYEINGESHTLIEWMRIYNIPTDENTHSRIRRKAIEKGIEFALTHWQTEKPVQTATINGVTKPIYQWAKEAGVHKNIVFQRLEYGYSIEEALKKENFIENGNRTKRKKELYGKYQVTQEEIDKINGKN